MLQNIFAVTDRVINCAIIQCDQIFEKVAQVFSSKVIFLKEPKTPSNIGATFERNFATIKFQNNRLI